MKIIYKDHNMTKNMFLTEAIEFIIKLNFLTKQSENEIGDRGITKQATKNSKQVERVGGKNK